MATAAASAEGGGPTAGSEEDIRPEGSSGHDPKGDSKKRKFKPLEAMRKFFKGGRKRSKSKDEQVSIVSMKAKSTTALYGQTSEDDDDEGGFSSQPGRPTPLHDKRSISEDSVFSPEHHETNLEGLKKTALSEENIHKSTFQAELFSKIKKRQSQCSDDDDGLPHSPTPAVTTADIIMGGGLKPLPFAGKSTSRESDKSLISVDGSENEDDDLFQIRWQSVIPGMSSRRRDSSPSLEASSDMDFESVQSTQVLSSEASKHKISIKPKTRRSRQSRKKRDVTPTGGLPSLNEESPSKVLAEDKKEDNLAFPTEKMAEAESVERSTTLVVSARSGETPKVSMATVEPTASSWQSRADNETASASSSNSMANFAKRMSGSYMPLPPAPSSSGESKPPAAAAAAAVSSSSKSVTPPVSASSPQDAQAKVAPAKPSEKPKDDSGAKSSEFAQAFSKIKRHSAVMDEPSKPQGDSVEVKTEPKGTVIQVHVGGEDKVVEESIRKNSVKSVDSLSSSANGAAPSSSTPAAPLNISVASARESKEKSVVTELKTPSEDGKRLPEDVDREKFDMAKTASGSYSLPGHASSSTQKLAESSSPDPSPRDDYKQRRQARSKTLPEQPITKEETSAVKVQRAASHRLITPPSSSPPSPRHPSGQVTPMSARPEPKRWSMMDAESSSGKEPEWMAMVRRRKAGKEEGEESSKEEPAPLQQVSSTPALKDFAHQRSKSVKVASKSGDGAGSGLPRQDSGKSFSPSVSPLASPSRSGRPPPTEDASPEASKPMWSTASSKPTAPKTEKISEVPKPSWSSSPKPEPVKADSSLPEASRVPAASSMKPAPAKVEEPAPEVSKFSRAASLKPAKTEELATETPRSFRGASVKQSFPKKEESEVSKPAWSSSSIKASAPKTEEPTPEPAKISSGRLGSVKPNVASPKPATTRGLTSAVQPSKDTSSAPTNPPWKTSSVAKKKESTNPMAPVKIEIIEKENATTPPVTPKSPDKPVPPSPEKSAEKCREVPAGRGSSKVLDMVKNFQKLQVS